MNGSSDKQSSRTEQEGSRMPLEAFSRLRRERELPVSVFVKKSHECPQESRDVAAKIADLLRDDEASVFHHDELEGDPPAWSTIILDIKDPVRGANMIVQEVSTARVRELHFVVLSRRLEKRVIDLLDYKVTTDCQGVDSVYQIKRCEFEDDTYLLRTSIEEDVDD